MKSWDTNFLLRHLLEDETEQLAVVRKQLKQSQGRGESVFLPQIVLVETAWVLRGLLSKKDVLATLRDVLEDDRFLCESPWEVETAIDRAMEFGDFSDHLIGAAAARADSTPVQSFDQAQQRSRFFEVHAVR